MCSHLYGHCAPQCLDTQGYQEGSRARKDSRLVVAMDREQQSHSKAQKRNPRTQRRSGPAALLASFRGLAIPGAIMGSCIPSLRHPHLLGVTICDQPGMTHEPPTGSQQTEDQKPRAKVRPRALTGWKPLRASSPAEQKP